MFLSSPPWSSLTPLLLALLLPPVILASPVFTPPSSLPAFPTRSIADKAGFTSTPLTYKRSPSLPLFPTTTSLNDSFTTTIILDHLSTNTPLPIVTIPSEPSENSERRRRGLFTDEVERPAHAVSTETLLAAVATATASAGVWQGFGNLDGFVSSLKGAANAAASSAAAAATS